MHNLWKTASFGAHFGSLSGWNYCFFVPWRVGIMKKYQRVVFVVCSAGAASLAVPSAAISQSQQCSTERPSNARSYWSYRLIDGRKCWYEGKPMMPKSMLHWAPAEPAAAENQKQETTAVPASRFNPLDAQASMSEEPVSFEARWRARILQPY